MRPKCNKLPNGCNYASSGYSADNSAEMITDLQCTYVHVYAYVYTHMTNCYAIGMCTCTAACASYAYCFHGMVWKQDWFERKRNSSNGAANPLVVIAGEIYQLLV